MNCYYGYYRNYVLEVYGNSLIKWNYGIPLPKKKEKKCLEQEKCQLWNIEVAKIMCQYHMFAENWLNNPIKHKLNTWSSK